MKKTLFLAAVVVLAACAPGNREKTATTKTETTETTSTTVPAANATMTTNPAAMPNPNKITDEEKPMSNYENKVAELHTSKGEIDLRFFPGKAPNHVKNFIDLSEKGFYNGVKFHRVIAGFVIQGGDPNTISGNRNTWGTGGSGTNIKAEFNEIHHKRGILSMARAGHQDSASSQFFICVADVPSLDTQYTVFGQVTKGMDVVDKIVAAAGGQELPSNPVTIESVKIREATDAEKGPLPK